MYEMAAQNDSFNKRTGTTDRGKEYEDLILANLALKYLQSDQIKDFLLSSNHSEFGSFDDIVIEAQDKNGNWNLNYALQLKHVNNTGSFKSKLCSEKGNFSLQKYCEDFNKLKFDHVDSYKFILFTNSKFDIEKDEEVLTLANNLQVRIYRVEQEILAGGSCFQCSLVDNEHNEYHRFFQQFYLYTNQVSVDDIKVQTLKLFEEMFKSDQVLAEQYLQFLADWSKSEGKKKKLKRGFVAEAIALTLLGPAIIPYDFHCKKREKKLDLFRSLIFENNVVFLRDKNGMVETIWDNLYKQLPKLDQVNKVGKEYRIVFERIEDVDDLDDITKCKFLWLQKHPVAVAATDSTVKAVGLCPGHKYILVGESPPLLSRLVLSKLSDLDQHPLYDQILDTFTCSLKNNTEISLRELLTRDKKIAEILTITELLKMAESTFKMADIVALLASADPETNAMCAQGFTPLHVACIKGHVALIDLITSSDIDLNGASKDGDSPLLLATQNNHHEIVKRLLEHGANPNAANARGDTPVQIACRNRNAALTIVKLLGEAKADINAADKDGSAPVQMAAASGDVPIVQLFIQLGVNVNKANEHGETALYLAARNGHPEVVKLLLEAGAKQIGDEWGNTPLIVACMNGHGEVARMLVDFGVNQGVRNVDGLSALDIAEKGKYEQIINLLS